MTVKANRDLAGESANAKAARTAKWATTMTKWRIAFDTGGRTIGSRTIRRAVRWQIVTFAGEQGSESRGIVDFVAIRKNHHHESAILRRGDLFEIVIVQVKGGSARWPSGNDLQRLRAVGHRYHAKAVVLAEWKKGRAPQFYTLSRTQPKGDPRAAWKAVDPGQLFK